MKWTDLFKAVQSIGVTSLWCRKESDQYKIGKNKDSNFGGKYLSCKSLGTGKSLSEALIFASTNPQYDDRVFIELQVQCMKIPSSNLGRSCCVQKLFLTFKKNFF